MCVWVILVAGQTWLSHWNLSPDRQTAEEREVFGRRHNHLSLGLQLDELTSVLGPKSDNK